MAETSLIDMAKRYPCPATIGTDTDEGFSAIAWPCGAEAGQECRPRSPEDVNWVHTERRELMIANMNMMSRQPVTEPKGFFGFLKR